MRPAVWPADYRDDQDRAVVIATVPSGPVEVPRIVTELAKGRPVPTRAQTCARIVTDGLPGRTAVDDRWKRDPDLAVRAIGAGPRALHEALPVADCPFEWSAEQRLRSVRSRAAAGRINPEGWHLDLEHVGTVERALGVLTDIPPVDELVVCHGDACAPNTLVGDDGRRRAGPMRGSRARRPG
jgi:aminoglycoside phosphotransferase